MHDDDPVSNHSGNRPFHEVAAARLSRRSVLAGGLLAAATTFVAPGLAAADSANNRRSGHGGRYSLPGAIEFTSIALQNGPMPTLAPEYEMSVILPWREKLDGSGHSYDWAGFTAEQQEQSLGIGHDGMWWFGGNTYGVMCLNHEFGTNEHVFGASAPSSLAQVRLSQAAHGVSVVVLRHRVSGWQIRRSPLNRRIHGNSPVSFSGPAASSDLLKTPIGNPPLGTLNNCSMGHTPWGTYLTCEENSNGYFGATGAWTPTAEQARYGYTAVGFEYGWHNFDPRFDLSHPDHRNEENRFHWVVEIDPNRPDALPVKRTALGRFKHEGSTVVEGRGGRVVVYSGDDERFDYIYKFVSSGNWRSMFARGVHPLDEGTLYVARFNEDGTGEWLELSPDNPALSGWTMDRILCFTRLAGDAVGATPMDRPEWITEGKDGELYCALTNNSRRGNPGLPGPDAANPLAPNPDGHIIRWRDTDHHTGTSFEWDIFLVSRDVADGAGQMFGSPDGLWCDPEGRLVIQTDGSQPGGNNDQMLVASTATGEVRRLFTGVAGCEVTGVTVTPNRRTLFANLQHPGNGDPAVTNWPAPYTGAGGPVPRDATVVITRRNGGEVGW